MLMTLTWTYYEGDEGLLVDPEWTCNEQQCLSIQDSDEGYILWEMTDDMTMLVHGRFKTLTGAKRRAQGIHNAILMRDKHERTEFV